MKKWLLIVVLLCLSMGGALAQTIAPDRPMVRYSFTDSQGKTVFMYVQYSIDHRAIEHVAFLPAENKDNSDLVYELVTDMSNIIRITVFMRSGQIENVQLDTDYRPVSDMSDPSVFRVKTDKGAFIRFIFTWDKQTVANVNVAPEENPFLALEAASF